MAEEISICKHTDLNNHIEKVMSQTNYTKEQTIEKLEMFNNDYLKVIKDFMGIPEKQNKKIISINQEIYKQIRTNLDGSMKEYRDKHPVNIEQIINNFNEENIGDV